MLPYIVFGLVGIWFVVNCWAIYQMIAWVMNQLAK